MKNLNDVKKYRLDGVLKVTGDAIYANDRLNIKSLVGYVVTSNVAHGIINNIDISQALKVPGVEKIISGKDINIKTGVIIEDIPLFAQDKVRYNGEPILIVIAKDTTCAMKAASLVKIDITHLPVVNSIKDAVKKYSPLVHDTFKNYKINSLDNWSNKSSNPLNFIDKSNIETIVKLRKGNYKNLFSDCDVIVDNSIKFSTSNAVNLEPKCSICEIDSSGQVNIYTCCQAIDLLAETISDKFNIPQGKIKITSSFIGGSYGAKESLQCDLLAFVSSKSVGGRCVKINYTREQDMITSPGHVGLCANVKIGATYAGKIKSMKINLFYNMGAYGGYDGVYTTQYGGLECSGPYNIENIWCNSYGVCLNHPPVTAYRGFGSVECSLLIERAIDKLSKKLKIDPFELRKINAINVGDSTPDQVVLQEGTIGNLEKVINKAKEISKWNDSPRYYETKDKIISKGVCCFWESNIYNNFNGSVVIYLKNDESLIIRCAATEVGQGTKTGLVKIAKDKLNIDNIFIDYEIDSITTPPGNVNSSSRMLMTYGRALELAIDNLIEKIKDISSSIFDCDKCDICVDSGKVYKKYNSSECISFKDIVNASIRGIEKNTDLIGTGSIRFAETSPFNSKTGKSNTSSQWTIGSGVVEVEVNKKDFTYNIKDATVVIDCGKVIDYPNAYAQVVGGMNMGLSFVAKEEFIFNNDGIVQNFRLRNYKVLNYRDAPNYIVGFVETPSSIGPSGARGIGEQGVFVGGALINALSGAIKKNIKNTPITPEILWKYSNR